MSTRARLITAAFCILIAAGSAWAQPLGTFRWQQQPYCNVLTLNVIGEGGNYTLDGTDDLCGATRKASVAGIAYLNPDGTIGFGLTLVTRPGGAPLHINATITLASLNGTWNDSDGYTGNFVFTPGAGTGGSARPASLPANRYLASNPAGNYVIGTANPTFGLLHVEGGSANAVYGTSTVGDGIYGTSATGRGVHGYSASSIGVYGRSSEFEGVRGESGNVNHGGVVGVHTRAGIAVFGTSDGVGVQGSSTGAGRGVIGTSAIGPGVYGVTGGAGVTAPGVWGVATSVGSIGVIGEANNSSSIGVHGVSANATGFGMYAKNLAGGRALYSEGPVAQNDYSGGIVKAMMEIYGWGVGQIQRCYNGVTGSSAGNCGFNSSRIGNGVYRIAFDFPVSSRFVVVTPIYDSGTIGETSNNIGANYRFFGNNAVEIFTFQTNSTNTIDAHFTMLVF